MYNTNMSILDRIKLEFKNKYGTKINEKMIVLKLHNDTYPSKIILSYTMPYENKCPMCDEISYLIQQEYKRTIYDFETIDSKSHLYEIEYRYHKFKCLNNKCNLNYFTPSNPFNNSKSPYTYYFIEEVKNIYCNKKSLGKTKKFLLELGLNKISRNKIKELLNL